MESFESLDRSGIQIVDTYAPELSSIVNYVRQQLKYDPFGVDDITSWVRLPESHLQWIETSRMNKHVHLNLSSENLQWNAMSFMESWLA